MLQPISYLNTNKIRYRNINFKNITSPAEVSQDSSQKFLQYMQERDKQEKTDKRNGYILTGVLLATSIGAMFFMPKIINKSLKQTSRDKGVKIFTSLKDDANIPTLETCKSINPKLKTFLENQVAYAKATKEDLIKTGSPSAANRLLMCGEPGSGKSFFSKIFAKTIDAEYTEIKYSDLNKQYCGEHLENMKNIFEEIITAAQKSPDKKFVVNFNEIDSIAQSAQKLGDTSSHSAFKLEERAVFLTYIEELADKVPNVTFIGSTNILPKNGRLDEAMMSRFQNIIEISSPDKECMLEALISHIETLPEGKEFIKTNRDKLDRFAQTLVERKASYRNLNNIVDSSKNYYLQDVIKDKKSNFKFEYLEKARDGLTATDGEIAGHIKK